MFERPGSGTKAVLVHIDFKGISDVDLVSEFHELVISVGAEPIATILGSRDRPDPKYFVGAGKAEEVKEAITECNADIVLLNHSISPSQERNLESLFKCRVVDRTGLILDIFALRANTYEGKLQVELAQLEYLSTRLVRGWTHLERQKGGIGLRGPGETQLETDRRLIGGRIKKLNERLQKLISQRDIQRRSRKKSELKTVSYVGYTNAGKSTLFNRVTGASLYAADQLFATLDPTLRRINLAGIGSVIVADTVGFIRELPHKLVAAFRATLEETSEADLLLHVIDVHDENYGDKIAEVEKVLLEIGAEEVPQIQVFNKIDLENNAKPRIDYDERGLPKRVWLSALSGDGLNLLNQAITEYLFVSKYNDLSKTKGNTPASCVSFQKVRLNSSAEDLHANLYQKGVVLNEVENDSGGWDLDLAADSALLALLKRSNGCELISREQKLAVFEEE